MAASGKCTYLCRFVRDGSLALRRRLSEWYRPISGWKDQHDAAVPKPGMVWDKFPYLHVVGVFRANAAEEPCDIPATTWFR